QVAFINAGALRINRDIAAGVEVTRREVEELLPYPSQTQRIRLDRPTLEAVLARSVRNWTGQGHWLQVAGLAFRHDPESRTVSDVTLLTPDGPRPLGADESVEAVTVTYLTTPSTGQDGYTMITPAHRVGEPGPAVKELVLEALENARDAGIAPVREGRICNVQRPGPCLAVPR
ncbi:MAG: 5'-nucleotidase C-terminal domain-containing protein, partial [Myxococcota bacterium]|nr:5'-nucleotidase C-terminal domain-containing protein [Myxococcota bacterium]